jgi:hypothetical protein
LTAVFAVAFALWGGRTNAWAASTGSPSRTSPAAQTTSADSRPTLAHVPQSPGSASLEDSYASREASSKNLEQFKGGDVVIIGSGGLVIVLLVILILVLV